jgi:flagella basal body P-ring formation protein FlgA
MRRWSFEIFRTTLIKRLDAMTSIACILVLLPLNGEAVEKQLNGDIRKTVETYLQQQLEQTDAGGFKIHVSTLDPRLKLNPCKTPLHASLAPGAKLFGKTTVAVQCDSPKPWKVFVPASLVLYQTVIAVARTIVRGEALGKDDIKMTTQQVNSSTNGYFHNTKQAIGFVAKRTIPAGKVLTAYMLQAPHLVRRGQEVILLATTPQLEVRMKGKALSDGAKGDVIKVRNVRSKRVVEGVVSDIGVVRVNM